MKIKLGNKSFNVKEAITKEEKSKGLQNVENLDKDSGMIFIYEEPQDVSFWMKNTKIPLDIVFIDDNYEVKAVQKGVPLSEDPIICKDVLLVVEVNTNSGISVGDELDMEEDNDSSLPKMKILAPDGSTQMELDGGERIVSRRETKILIKKAKKAYNSKRDNDYKSLGKYIFKVFKKQDNRDPEYVKTPE